LGKDLIRKQTGTWDQLGIHPGKLTNLVSKGKAKIVGHALGKNIYKIKCDPTKYLGETPVGESCPYYRDGECRFGGDCDLKAKVK